MRIRLDWRDGVIVALLFGGTLLYWMSLPHSLGPADESVHLYEAKRVLDGEVLYRDVFNFITPGWFYLVASLFWAFGTSIDTARVMMASVHALSALFVYFSCRRFAVGRTLSWLTALANLVICQTAFPVVSQHWISTLLSAVLVLACARRNCARPGWALWPGCILGLLISVQQQRGAFMAGGVAVWLVADALLRRRYGAGSTARALVTELAALAAGVVAVVGSVLGVAIVTAGVQPVWNALVIFPLFNYGTHMHCPWGDVNLMSAWGASFTFPRVLKYAPVPLIASAGRLAYLAATRRDLATARGLTQLLLFSAAAAASIAYFPDFIKISFVASVFLIAGAENVECALRSLPAPAALKRGLVWTAAALLLLAGGRQLHENRTRLQAAFPVSHATAFGRIDFPTEDEARLRDVLAGLLAETPTRDFYAYPILADLYLTVPAHNPTPYGFFLASGYHSPAQVQHVVDILAARKLPYIVAAPGFRTDEDPVYRYILAEYEPLSPTPFAGRMIYRRKPDR